MPRYTKPRKTWQYSKEFKRRAVEWSLQDGVQVQDVAANLDIHPFMLSRWRKEYRKDVLQCSRKVKVSPKKDIKRRPKKALSELEKLRRENAQLKEENDLLKKWQRYLSEQHQSDLDSSRDIGN